MSEIKQTPAPLADYRRLARELAQGSIVTKALAKFLEQVIAEVVNAERERCKAIYDAETDCMLQEYMKALEDADHWHAHVGTLLGIIEQTYDLGDDIGEEDRPAYDQIDEEYGARCLENKEAAAQCRSILERAKANVSASSPSHPGRTDND